MKTKKKEPFSVIWQRHKSKYLMILPFGLLFVLFTVLPVAAAMLLSLTSFNMAEMPKFVGFENYINLLVQDDIFLIAVKNTFVLALVTGPLSYLMCFMLAWLINELPPVPRALLTLVFYAPSLSGNAFLFWKLFFSSDSYGFANAWAMKLGIIDEPILFFSTAEYILPILIVVQLWLSLGVSFLAFIAGLQTVDKSLYEAAAVEGIKNRWQELWYITLPSMKPQLMFGAVMQITSAFSIADVSLNLAGNPSVNYAGATVVTHLLDYGTVRLEMGYASAIATVLFLLMVGTNMLIQRLLRRVGE